MTTDLIDIGGYSAPLEPPWRTRFRRSVLGRLLHLRLARIGLFFVVIVVFCAAFAPQLSPYGPTEFAGEPAESAFTTKRVLGTDALGRDQLTRLLYGARASVQVAVMSVLIGVTIGVVLGLVGAYFRGVTDAVLMRFMDAMLSLPGLVLPLTSVVDSCVIVDRSGDAAGCVAE